MKILDKSIFKDLLPESPVIIEVGSFDGTDSAELAEMFGVTVTCYEPCRESFEKCIQHERLYVYNYAISDKPGMAEMHLCSGHPKGNSLNAPEKHMEIFPQWKFDGVEDVKVTTLDIMHPEGADLLWVDANGGELAVIRGGLECLKKTRFLYIEFEEVELFKGAATRAQLLEALPGWEIIDEFNFAGNYGDLLLKNGQYI